MVASDSAGLFAELFGATSSVTIELSKHGFLSKGQRATMSAIAAGSGATSFTYPDEDNEVVYCLKQVMSKTQSG